MLGILTFCEIPLLVGPNIIFNASTDGLSTCQIQTENVAVFAHQIFTGIKLNGISVGPVTKSFTLNLCIMTYLNDHVSISENK